MDDETVKNITQQLTILYPDLVEDVSPDSFEPLIEQADLVVSQYDPPKSAYNQLLMLYTGALINNFDGSDLSSVKINNVQINASATSDGNPWLSEFRDLLNALGLYQAGVIGF